MMIVGAIPFYDFIRLHFSSPLGNALTTGVFVLRWLRGLLAYVRSGARLCGTSAGDAGGAGTAGRELMRY